MTNEEIREVFEVEGIDGFIFNVSPEEASDNKTKELLLKLQNAWEELAEYLEIDF